MDNSSAGMRILMETWEGKVRFANGPWLYRELGLKQICMWFASW